MKIISDAGLAISIALAVYNGEKHLGEQLASLARQDLLPCELVVSDDGSSDKSLSILREFAETAPFPVFIHQNKTRLGFADNFLSAASRCKGGLIAFCDQDDVWCENKLQVCSEYFSDPDISVVVHSAELWDGQSRLGRYFPYFESDQVSTPGISNPLALTPGFAMVFRQQLLQLASSSERPGCHYSKKNDALMGHDGWVWLLGSSVGKVATLHSSLALYRQHASNTVGAPKKRGIWQYLQQFAHRIEYQKLAIIEKQCVAVLSSISTEVFPNLLQERKLVIRRFTELAALHSRRTQVYDLSNTLATRAAKFFSLLVSGAYFSANLQGRLGARAAIKDFFYGVPGLHRRFTRKASHS